MIISQKHLVLVINLTNNDITYYSPYIPAGSLNKNKTAKTMKQTIFPELEGIETLSCQAMASIEAAKKEASSTCESCTKSKETTETTVKVKGTVDK